MKFLSGWVTTCWRGAGRNARNAGVGVALAFLCLMGGASQARAQGSRKDDIVFNAQGRPMAGATVRICTSSATGQPCSPLANIYSDAALTQALSNPIATDGLGNYSFYATPGRYMVEISGPTIATKQIPNVILPNDPSAPTFATVTTTSGISAFSLSLSGNLTVTGSAAVTGGLTAGGAPVATTSQTNTFTAAQNFSSPVTLTSAALQGGNVAAKSPPTHNVRYVTGNGSNANDGLSVGSAKADVWSAVFDLINTGKTQAGGTIYFTQNNADLGHISATDPAFQTCMGTFWPQNPCLEGGIWIMGTSDPNYVATTGLARSGGSVTVTTAASVPTSAYYQTGRTITVSACADTSYDGNFVIGSAFGSSITYNQSGAGSSTSGCVVTPLGWLPQIGAIGLDFRCAGGTAEGPSPGSAAPTCGMTAGQWLGGGTITSISESGTTVTATVTGTTNFFPGLPVEIAGVGTTAYNGYWIVNSTTSTTFTFTNPTSGLGTDTGGGTFATIIPSLWLSGVSGITLRDMFLSGPLPAVLGLDSNFTPNPAIAASSYHFIDTNFAVAPLNSPLPGPATWIGSNLLWVYFDNCSWGANAAAPETSDNRSAILMKSIGGGASSGLVHIWHGNSAGGGGLRWYQEAGSSSFHIDGFVEEGTGQSQPVIDVVSSSGALVGEAHNISISDSGDWVPTIRVPQGFQFGNSSVVWYGNGSSERSVQGPVTIIDTDIAAQANGIAFAQSTPSVSPQGQGQSGFDSGRLLNLDTNVSRSNGPPVFVRFPNIAATNPSGWSAGEGTGVTVSTGAADRFGGTNAARLSCTGNGGDGYCSRLAYSGSQTFSIGDYVVASVWVQSGDHSAGSLPNSGSINITGLPMIGATYRSNYYGGPNQTSGLPQNDGGWQRIFLWGKAAASGSGTVQMRLTFGPAHPMSYFAPQFYVIPGSQVAIPAASSLSQAAGGSLPATTYYVRTTYLSALGETNVQTSDATLAASANSVIAVATPPSSPGATGWNVYVGNSTTCPGAGAGALTGPGETCEVRQNSSPIAIGTNWTEPTSGITIFTTWYDGANTGADRTEPTNDTTNAYGDSEIADWALDLGDFNSTCAVNQLCSINGPITGGAFSTQSSAYTLKVTDSWVNVTGTTTVTVPHAIVGQRWVVFNSGSNTVTVQGDSGNVNGAASITLSANTGKEITCDGSNCFAH